MNKNEYKMIFSQVHPSEEAIERIIDMTQKRNTKNVKKILITAAIIISVLFSIAAVANAATDGAVSEAFSEIAENISKEIRVLINGKETDYVVNVSEKSDETGDLVYAEIIVTDENGGENEIVIASNGDAGDYNFGEIDIIMSDSIDEAFVPTTSEAE